MKKKQTFFFSQPEYAYDFSNMLKIIESVVTVLTKLQHQRSQLPFTIVKIQKQPFSSVQLRHFRALPGTD